jgi:hypothetical protein
MLKRIQRFTMFGQTTHFYAILQTYLNCKNEIVLRISTNFKQRLDMMTISASVQLYFIEIIAGIFSSNTNTHMQYLELRRNNV